MPETPELEGTEAEGSCFARLTSAGEEVIRGNYQAAAQIFDMTREGRCLDGVGELAEILGLMTVKVQARERALEKALAEVKKKNADLKRAVQLRAEFSKLFSGTIILLCFYAAAVSFLRNVAGVPMTALAWPTHLVNLGLFVMLGGMMVWFLRRHHYPMQTFGLTWKNWRRALAESLAICVPTLAALVAFKASLVRYDPAYMGRPVIEWTNWGPWQMFVVYAFVASAQELSTRGFMQTCIERVLPGKRRVRLAILLAAAEFGVVHLHYSFALGMLAFFGAVLFGTLYARHRTIVGITVAHYILGQLIFGPLQLVR
jgi:hypothetical protein